MIDAALNDTVLKFYFYADRNTTGNYFYGQVYLSMDSRKATLATSIWNRGASPSAGTYHAAP